MRAVIYTRASLDLTGDGKSNTRQREENQKLCDYKGWQVVSTQEDFSISAYGDKVRPAWNQVLEMIERDEVDVVVAWHLDRLTRNMSDLEKLIVVCEKHGVGVATATGDIDLTTDTGRMIARILAAVARQEVERKAARQRLAHVQRRQEGRPWSKCMGYTREGEVVEAEAEALRVGIRELLDGVVTLAELGRRWHEMGFTSPHRKEQKPYTVSGVKRQLLNPRIAGYVTHNGEIVGQGNWEPIIDDDTLARLTSLLNEPSRGRGQMRGPKPLNLLTGVMVCAVCDGGMNAGSFRGTKTYTCKANHLRVNRDEADALVRSAFATAIATTQRGAVLPAFKGSADPEGVEAEVETLAERRSLLTKAFIAGQVPASDYENGLAELNAKIKALTEQSGSQPSNDWAELRAKDVQGFLEADLAEQRRVLETYAVVKAHRRRGRNPHARQQIEVRVRTRRGGVEVLIPAFVPDTIPTHPKGAEVHA